jgi:hypothetical protein
VQLVCRKGDRYYARVTGVQEEEIKNQEERGKKKISPLHPCPKNL